MNVSDLCLHVNNSITRSLRGDAICDSSAFEIKGFSTPTIRRLFSNLCRIEKENPTYLECGLFCGASFCAAISNNPTLIAYGIENFSQDFSEEDVLGQLKNSYDKYKSSESQYLIFDSCFEMSKSIIDKQIDIFFFDAEHSEESQAKALPYFLDCMSDNFIFVVDDTNWESVRKGTLGGFVEIADKITINAEWHKSGARIQDDPIWHNGVSIYVISRVKS